MGVPESTASLGDSCPRQQSTQSPPGDDPERALAGKAITGFELFGEKEASSVEGEAMAWELAALAVQHLNAVGCYRATSSSDGPTIYLAITELNCIRH